MIKAVNCGSRSLWEYTKSKNTLWLSVVHNVPISITNYAILVHNLDGLVVYEYSTEIWHSKLVDQNGELWVAWVVNSENLHIMNFSERGMRRWKQSLPPGCCQMFLVNTGQQTIVIVHTNYQHDNQLHAILPPELKDDNFGSSTEYLTMVDFNELSYLYNNITLKIQVQVTDGELNILCSNLCLVSIKFSIYNTDGKLHYSQLSQSVTNLPPMFYNFEQLKFQANDGAISILGANKALVLLGPESYQFSVPKSKHYTFCNVPGDEPMQILNLGVGNLRLIKQTTTIQSMVEKLRVNFPIEIANIIAKLAYEKEISEIPETKELGNIVPMVNGYWATVSYNNLTIYRESVVVYKQKFLREHEITSVVWTNYGLVVSVMDHYTWVPRIQSHMFTIQ